MMVHQYIMQVPTQNLSGAELGEMLSTFEADGFAREQVMLTVAAIPPREGFPDGFWIIVGKVEVPE